VTVVSGDARFWLRVSLDIILNHSGYDCDCIIAKDSACKPWPGYCDKGLRIDVNGAHHSFIGGDDDSVIPSELRADNVYTRARKGNLGAHNIKDPQAEHQRTDRP